MSDTTHILKSHAEVEKAFRNLRQKAKSLGIQDSSLARAKCLKTLRRKRVGFKYFAAALVCMLAVMIGCGVYAVNKNYIDKRVIAEFVSGKLLDIDIESDNCLLPIPEFVLDLFRPPVNCKICKSVHEVDRVSNITPEEFAAKYAYSGRPVVIVDGMKNWTASEHFSFEYFKKVYGPDSPVLKNQDKQCQFFPYQTKFDSLQQVFEMPEKDSKMEGKPWYIGWSNCDSAAANELRKHYNRPYFLPEMSESSRTDWIFMGCPGYGAHMHIDQVGKPSWQAQIRGTKKWTLQPPPECAFECDPQIEAIIHPGEIIVLDTDKWFHQTDIVNNEMSITIGSEYD